MQLHRASVLVLAAVLLGACAHRPPAGGAEAEPLQRRQSGFLEALSARDVDATVGHFADDAVLHIAGMPAVQGRESIRRFYGNVYRFLSSSAPEAEAPRIARAGDMAYTTGRVTNVFAGQGGAEEHVGKFLLVWERRDGVWQIVVYGVTADVPATGR